MADKKKPNYADSLKGAARSVTSSSAAGDGEEVVYIDVGGEVLPYPRGKGANRLDDAAWERVKARAVPTESKDMKSKPLGWSDLMGLGQNLDGVADSVVSKEQKELLKKTDEWTRAEYLRQRFKAKGYEVPPNSADDERKSYKDGKRATDVGVTKPDQGSPDEWKAPPEKATIIPSTVEMDNQKPMPSSAGRTEDDAMVGSADPGMSVRGQMARLATGATGNPMLDAVGEKAGEVAADAAAGVGANVVSRVSPIVEPARMVAEQVDQRVFGDKPLIPDEVKQLPQAVGAGMATDLGSIGQVAGKALGMPNLAKAGANLSTNAVMPPAYGGPPLPAQPPAGAKPAPGELPAQQQPPAPAPIGGSGSAAASLMSGMPGGFRIAQTDPEAIKAEREALAQAAAKNKEAEGVIKGAAQNQQTALEESVRFQREKMAAGEQLAAEAAQAQREYVVKAEQFENARLSVLAEARKAASNPIDPNRYWNNKDAGQKAAAVIAGALFGYSGQGMQWLQRLDGLVAQDNQLQAQDRASRVQGLNAEAAGLGESAQLAMQHGASLAQAKLIEKAAKYESAKAYADQFGMTTQNAQFQMNAANVSAQLGAKLADLAQQGHQLASMDAAHTNSARAQSAQLMQEKAKLSAKIAMSGAGGEQLRGPQVQNLNDMMDAIKSAKNMSESFKRSASGFLSKITALDPTGTTGASDYNARRDVVVQLVGRALEGGVLREGDIARYQKMIPSAGDLRGAERWDQLIVELQQRLATGLQGFRGAGFDVGTLPQQAAGVLGGGGSPRRVTEREMGEED